MKRYTVPLLGLTLVAAVVGCTSVRFPYGMSFNKHNFISDAHLPKTVSLVDTVTNQTVWSLDIPVGKMAVVDLDPDKAYLPSQTGSIPATKVSWGIFEPTDTIGTLEDSQELSGNPVMLKVDIRQTAAAAPAPASGEEPAAGGRPADDSPPSSLDATDSP